MHDTPNVQNLVGRVSITYQGKYNRKEARMIGSGRVSQNLLATSSRDIVGGEDLKESMA